MKLVANNKRATLLAVVAVPLLVVGAWLVAAERGPFECDNGCGIGWPKPDQKTFDYIEQMKPLFNRWFGDAFWNKGDIYIVCNSTHCAKYYITDDFGVFGTNDGRMNREGGREGGGPSTGGNTGGGGCVASCGTGGGGTGTGTVIVYEPLPEKQER